MAIELLTSLVALPLLLAEPAAPTTPLAQQASPGVWMGVSLTEDEDDGLEVTSVFDGSPAERAGLRAGDRIIAAGGNELGSFEELLEELSRRRPGSKLALWVQREAKVQLDPKLRSGDRPLLGVVIGESDGGAKVSEAQQNHPAIRGGIRAGDVITSINGERVRSVDDLIDTMAEVGNAKTVVLSIGREVGLVLAARPGAGLPPGRVERVEPDEPRLRRRMEAPEGVPLPRARANQGALQEELRELAQDLRELRAEIAELRKELDRMRRRGAGER